MDLTLETAASDLYASDWQTFRFVTLPLLAARHLRRGMMLAFVTSLDDVVITVFVKSAGTGHPAHLYAGRRSAGR